MSQSAGLIFTNDAGSQSGTSSYVSDTFSDYTFPPNSNVGFSSTVSNNPLNLSYGNTDLPQYGAKHLPIKDLVFITDRSQWINGKQTYRVIFFENYPQVQAFVFGNIQLNKSPNGEVSILVKSIGDGISVNGVIRQVGFVLRPNSAPTATAQVIVDSANEGTTIDFSSQTSSAPTNPSTYNWSLYLHNSALESYNIHDIRLVANQASTLSIGGIVVYFQGPNGVIDQFPGTSYINKSKATSISGVSMTIPSFGSSLGGNFVIYKTGSSGYTLSALSASTIIGTASGSSGTNLLNFATGTGGSFIAGYGLIVTQGSSTYIGSIVSMSTDTATMGNTIGFGFTAGSPVYAAWKSGSTLAINASLMYRAFTLDFSRLNQTNGFSQTIFEPQGQYAFWGNNIGLTAVDGNQCAVFLGASGFMQLDGYFCAAEMEMLGNATFSATLAVNGFASWSVSAAQTGTVKNTIFTDAGPGWNSINIGPGASLGSIGIQRINLYQRDYDRGSSYGLLADFDVCQTFTNRNAINASMMALGGVRRVYADQIYFKNAWSRGQTWSVAGGVYYQGASTNGSFSFQYYGQQFGFVGTLNSGSTLLLDGVGITLSPAGMYNVATLGFHTVSYSGGTAQISAIDFVNPVYRSKVDTIFSGLLAQNQVIFMPPTWQFFTGGTGTYSVPQYPKPLYLRVRLIGGGGGGSGNVSNGTSGGGGAGGYVEFNLYPESSSYSYTVASGASGGAAGGTASFGNITSFGLNSALGGGGGGPGIGGQGGGYTLVMGFGFGINGNSGGTVINDSGAGCAGGAGGAGIYGGTGPGSSGTGSTGSDASSNSGSGGTGGSSTNGPGGRGAAGLIIVEEHYQ